MFIGNFFFLVIRLKRNKLLKENFIGKLKLYIDFKFFYILSLV